MDDLRGDYFKILNTCTEFANKVEIILKPFRQRIIVNILCDFYEEYDKQTGKSIRKVAISEKYTITDYVSLTIINKDGSQEVVIPLDNHLQAINFFIKNMKLIAKKFKVDLEELKNAVKELLIAYGAMEENCNMCTSYRFYEVLKVIFEKLKLDWDDLEPYFNKSVVPESLKEKKLKNIIKEITKRMNKPLSELSIEERHAKVKTTDSRKNEKIPPLTSKQICQVMKELLEAFLKKSISIFSTLKND